MSIYDVIVARQELFFTETRVQIRKRLVENSSILLINDVVKEDIRCHCCDAKYTVHVLGDRFHRGRHSIDE